MAFSQPLPKPLTREDERTLLERSYAGDERARDKLIEHNIRLVIHVANRFKTKYFEGDDLSSVGTIGLIKAVRTFDIKKEIKFATYASRCIENEILMMLRQTKKRDQEDSFENTVHSDGEGGEVTLFDKLGTDKEEIVDQVLFDEKVEQLKETIFNLPYKEREIILFRYGIDREKKCQSEVANLLSVSQSYISRVEKKILKKLRMQYKSQSRDEGL